jgi:hypothetical protein
VLSDSAVAGLALGIAVLALVLAVGLALQLRRLRRGYDALVGAERGAGFAQAFTRAEADRAAVRKEVDALRADLAGARTDLAAALRHVAVVRYDAFGDMGGRLSFSAALLDDAGDGVVLTSINGRSETRTYAKSVVGASSEHALSPEEQEAIGRATPPGAGGRRSRSSSRTGS